MSQFHSIKNTVLMVYNIRYGHPLLRLWSSSRSIETSWGLFFVESLFFWLYYHCYYVLNYTFYHMIFMVWILKWASFWSMSLESFHQCSKWLMEAMVVARINVDRCLGQNLVRCQWFACLAFVSVVKGSILPEVGGFFRVAEKSQVRLLRMGSEAVEA